MRCLLPIFACLSLAACGGVAWDTTLADAPAARLAMAASVVPGLTTEGAHVARWGPPYQKIREGGEVTYVYRGPDRRAAEFVLVRFQYGRAVSVLTSEFERCRASFSPRVPGYGVDTWDRITPIGDCAPPPVADGGSAPRGGPGLFGQGTGDGPLGRALAALRPGVPEDRYSADPAAGK